MIVRLSEWGSVSGLELDRAQTEALARSPKFGLEPDPEQYGRWKLRASQYVGVAHFGDLEVRVSPKVSVHRLMELLCTSIERVQWDERDTVWSHHDDLLTTVASSFAAQAERVVSGGLLQGYVTVDETLLGVRGRVAIGRQIARNPGMPIPVEVTYDDYSTNITENQLLAGAGRLLLKLKGLPKQTESRLRRLEFQLIDVSPSRPSPTPPTVVWSRLNQRYRPAVALARLILRSCSLEDAAEPTSLGSSFLVDMNRVFEDVVGETMRDALRPEGFVVDLQRTDYLDAERQFAIRPDALVSASGQPVAVADVKYKRPADGIPPGDVFQVISYATRYGLDSCTLVYADRPPVSEVHAGHITVRFESVHLDSPPSDRRRIVAELAARLLCSGATGAPRPRMTRTNTFGFQVLDDGDVSCRL